MKTRSLLIIGIVILFNLSACQTTEEAGGKEISSPGFEGSWNILEDDGQNKHVSWLEITSDGASWKGRFLHRGGHAQPARIEISGEELKVTLEPEGNYAANSERKPPTLTGRIEGGKLVGTGTGWRGTEFTFSADRAPDRLEGSDREVEWGNPIQLFNGSDLAGWETLGDRPNQWKAEDGMLVNADTGANIRTVSEFRDFKLHAEWMIPEGSNSGIYLRGRYETQVMDSFGQEPHSRGVGGIYGFVTPTVNAVKPAGEWNTVDVTLIGYRVTVVINEQTTIDGQLIDGITGGALDPYETEPGPIMLQGDHGPVYYRNIVLTPAN